MKTASVTKTMRQQLGTGLVRFSGVVSGVAPAFRCVAFMKRAPAGRSKAARFLGCAHHYKKWWRHDHA